MIRGWLLFFLMVSFSFAHAQTKISGVVSNKEDGKGLAGVNVTVKEKKSETLLTYALTDDKGAYQLNFKSAADSVVITVSGFNLKKQSEIFANKSQNLNFNITAEAIKLKEIKINPPKIRRLNDTLNYLVDGFLDKNDRTIGDVLKKMPGITVKDDGSITYNNKPINKFYIENHDLLQGRYGIATNNIEAKDVATVQVLENHQPIKALRNKQFTDEGAINLKLKDSAKGVLVANAQLGAGLSPLLWNNELFSMYFDKGRQNMNTYKGNNTGEDAAAELNSFYPGDRNLQQANSLSVQAPSPPGISQKRYLFNQANAVSVNNLWTYGKNYELKANISYLNDRQEKNSYSRSVYYLPVDSVLTIEETMAATEHLNKLNAVLNLNTNRDKYYLDNSLKFTSEWNNEQGNVLQSENIFQDLNKPLFAIANTFNLVRNYKKTNLNIYSYNGYSSTPQTLSVQPVLYEDLFEGSTALSLMKQSLRQGYFSSVNKLSFGLGNGAWKQNYTLGLNAELQQLQSKLQAQSPGGNFTEAPDSLRNDLNWNKYELYLGPDYTYAKNKLKATITIPLTYNYLYANDKITQQNKNINRLFFNPSFTLRYDLNLFWNLSAYATYSNDLGKIENGFTGYIMQSYRNLVRNDGELPEQKNHSYRLDFGYRHPLHELFFNAGADYSRNKKNLLYGYDYQDVLSLRKTYNISNVADRYSVYAQINKGIDVLASTVNLDIHYSNSSASQISQDQIVDFTNEMYSIAPGISSKIGSWASLSYSFQYAKSKNKVHNDFSNFTPIRSSIQRGQLNFFPAKGFIINLAYENFYNSAIVSGSRTMKFADIGIKYTYKKMEFNLGYTNIFNTRQFISTSYDAISTYYASYDLRPAQVLMKVRFKIK